MADKTNDPKGMWVAWEPEIRRCSGGVGRSLLYRYAGAGPTREVCLSNYRSNKRMGSYEPIPDNVKVLPIGTPPPPPVRVE